MRVENVKWEEDEDGYPFTSLMLDGKPAVILAEQNLPKAGAVQLHPLSDWKHLPLVVIPEDGNLGRPETTATSATDDPTVVQLWWDMHRALETNDFNLGSRPISKAMTVIDNAVVIDAVPNVPQVTERFRNLLYASFESIGRSLTVGVFQELLDAYAKEPNDERHPIDIWVALLQKQLGWFALPDISTELTKIFVEMYAESVLVVLRRFIDLAFGSNQTDSLAMPKVNVTPDLNLLASHAEEVLDMVDDGTLYFIAKILSEHPNYSAADLMSLVVGTLLLPAAGFTVCESRVSNINNYENSWVRERCALDLLATLGAAQKVWNLSGEAHGPHCIANSRRGAVTLDASYGTDTEGEVLHPPASPTCSCYLVPGADDLANLAKRLAVTKSSVVPDQAMIWIDVPEPVAANLSLTDAGIGLVAVEGISIMELNSALNKLSLMVKPFGVTLSGEVGVQGNDDVAWVLVTPKLIHARNELLTLLGLTPLEYRPCIHLGPAGKSGAEFITEFGEWVVFGLRLAVRIGDKEDSKFYPFIKPTNPE